MHQNRKLFLTGAISPPKFICLKRTITFQYLKIVKIIIIKLLKLLKLLLLLSEYNGLNPE
jgi:hypothetical protein